MIEELRVGVITSAFGIKGEAKVFPTTDTISNFSKIKECKLVSENNAISINTKLEYFRKNKNLLICKFENFSSPEEVKKHSRFSIFVARKDLPKLKENENYIADLIGLKVLDEEKKCLGEVLNIFDTGANQVMEIKLINDKKVLIPYVKECIKDVNLEEQFILVNLIDGLLDLQY